jgi:DNA invertase Pin-like site-specific DNA recombinase/peptidoglycan hydrolase-like protein with peptidoglycan-binding domain
VDWTYRRPSVRAALLGLAAALVLAAGAGISLAASALRSVRTVEMVEAVLLAKDAGYGGTGRAARVREWRRALSWLGRVPGRVDGHFGPRTEAAVFRLQGVTGLPSHGIVGTHTAKALGRAPSRPFSRGAGYQTAGGSRRVRLVKRRLVSAGLRPGPLDRRLGPHTEAAVTRLHRAATLGGAVDSPMRRLLARGAKQPGGVPPVAAAFEAIGPQALQSMALSSVVARAAAGGHTVGLMLALGFTGVALFLGALCGALASRADPTRGSAGPTSSEQEQEQHGQGLVESGKTPNPQPHIRSVTAGGPHGSTRVVGYVSVSEVNGDDAAAVAQADAIHRLCERFGWELLHVVRDVENGRTKGLDRPGLQYALERIADRDASCLVVSHLERLTRSAADLGRIVEWFEQCNGRLVAIDLRLDTGSAEGRLTARTLVAIGKWEGRRIADRTKKGLAAARARRATTGPPTVDDRPGLRQHIVALRNQGMTLQAIADRLNAEQVPTLRGGTKWRPSSVHVAAGYRRPNNKRPIVKGQRNEKQG